jgi:pre-mRNA-splicing helicase BRR2
MSNKKVSLPKGSTKLQKNGYEEVYVPAIRHKAKGDERLIPIRELPSWAQKAFPDPIKELN